MLPPIKLMKESVSVAPAVLMKDGLNRTPEELAVKFPAMLATPVTGAPCTPVATNRSSGRSVRPN